MALVATFFYRKGSFAVVARTAGFCRFHLGHGSSLVSHRGQIELVVAVAAFIHARMQLVTELDISYILDLEIDFLYRMAPQAVLDLKSFFTVVTKTAGFSLFHLRHPDRLITPPFIGLGMTTPALIAGGVLLMAEDDGSRFFYFENYIRNFMAFIAILDIKSLFPVVTKTAGFPLSHVRHSVACLFFDVEDGMVACFTIIADAFLVDMKTVIEFYLAVIRAAESDILNVYGMGEGKNKDGS